MRTDFVLSPWTEMNRVWNLLDRQWPNTKESDFTTSGFPIDMYQQDGRIFVRASVPGVKPEDLQVNLENGVLTISGETNEPFKEEKLGGRIYHREHSYGRFVRSVRLPSDINQEQIDAQFENGVLEVSMPINKPQQPLPKQIPVRSVQSERAHAGGDAFAETTRKSAMSGGGPANNDATRGGQSPTKAGHKETSPT
ncbi:MAG TPA: Hsp20/alpha crystallin family protein [Fimbriimonas sp.]|nr:Hsp20/alpha crystallin family protein [Fimbriimonas sp.]